MDVDTKRLASDVLDPIGSSLPVSTPGQDGVEGLLGLLKDMKPYLDSFGHAYCGVLGRDAKGRGGWPLDSEPVVSLLTYRYFDLFRTTPSKTAIDLARMIVIGELWETREVIGGVDGQLPPLVKVILSIAEKEGDFIGSATEAMEKLQEHARKDAACLQRGEHLPDGPDQLGVKLSQHVVLLRDLGVEVFRPQRKDVKRLWAWRKLRPVDDTGDTPDTEPPKESGVASSDKTAASGNTDATDRLTPTETRLMSTYRGDHDDDRSAA